MDDILLTEETLDVAEVVKRATEPSVGAVSLFVGTTRDECDGKRVVNLEYEAYYDMAIKELKALCALARDRWPEVRGIVIRHRLGVVPVCEASVMVAAASAHRAQALEAVHFLIDGLKASVPIWKKETYEDGHTYKPVWKANKECKWSQS